MRSFSALLTCANCTSSRCRIRSASSRSACALCRPALLPSSVLTIRSSFGSTLTTALGSILRGGDTRRPRGEGERRLHSQHINLRDRLIQRNDTFCCRCRLAAVDWHHYRVIHGVDAAAATRRHRVVDDGCRANRALHVLVAVADWHRGRYYRVADVAACAAGWRPCRYCRAAVDSVYAADWHRVCRHVHVAGAAKYHRCLRRAAQLWQRKLPLLLMMLSHGAHVAFVNYLSMRAGRSESSSYTIITHRF